MKWTESLRFAIFQNFENLSYIFCQITFATSLFTFFLPTTFSVYQSNCLSVYLSLSPFLSLCLSLSLSCFTMTFLLPLFILIENIFSTTQMNIILSSTNKNIRHGSGLENAHWTYTSLRKRNLDYYQKVLFNTQTLCQRSFPTVLQSTLTLMSPVSTCTRFRAKNFNIPKKIFYKLSVLRFWRMPSCPFKLFVSQYSLAAIFKLPR